MSNRKTNAQRMLCLSDVFRDEDVQDIKRFADARAYRIGAAALLLCSFLPFKQDAIDRAQSFGWLVQPIPRHAVIPKLIANARQTIKIETVKQPPGRTPIRLTQTERNDMAHKLGENNRSVRRSRKL